jgi:catechol 2,3-dioxygenase-like lactoylglutathione lyase family enzyme
VGIPEVIIAVGDLEQAVEFYTRVVGCRLVRTLEGEPVVELDVDGQRITLLRDTAPGIHLVFPTDDAGRMHRRLKRRHVPTRSAKPVGVPGGAWLGFADPWGNRLAFWEERPVGDDSREEDSLDGSSPSTV